MNAFLRVLVDTTGLRNAERIATKESRWGRGDAIQTS